MERLWKKKEKESQINQLPMIRLARDPNVQATIKFNDLLIPLLEEFKEKKKKKSWFRYDESPI